MAKVRLDQLLVARGLARSRTAAQALVLEGRVRVAGQVETKAGRPVSEDAELAVEAPPRFVSRGGEKLEGAFARFPGWTVEGLVCLDVGSSTGGFTDCMLQHGAARVMAIDVGTNQLAYKLRSDPRVWVRENFNARFLSAADLPERPARAVTDVSFISLKLILPPMADVLLPGGEIVSLVKPQFEAGRGNAPGGVVSDPAVRARVVADIAGFGTKTLGLELLGVEESPIRGREKGNVEYLAWWRKGTNGKVAS
ncbi:MAG: TlyA family RNA methyltransferase [Kiritimatiellia bacterium]